MPRTPEDEAALTLSMSSSFVPTLPICGKVKVMIWPGIGGVGEDLLIAGHRRVEADLARRLADGADAEAFEHGAVLQHEERGARAARSSRRSGRP